MAPLLAEVAKVARETDICRVSSPPRAGPGCLYAQQRSSSPGLLRHLQSAHNSQVWDARGWAQPLRSMREDRTGVQGTTASGRSSLRGARVGKRWTGIPSRSEAEAGDSAARRQALRIAPTRRSAPARLSALDALEPGPLEPRADPDVDHIPPTVHLGQHRPGRTRPIQSPTEPPHLRSRVTRRCGGSVRERLDRMGRTWHRVCSCRAALCRQCAPGLSRLSAKSVSA